MNDLAGKARFGYAYEDVIRGKEIGYCLNINGLIDLTNKSFVDATMELELQINQIINDINEQMEPNYVDKFTIGKSYVRRATNTRFAVRNPNTWRLDDGVNRRWTHFYADENYDGLIVLCVTPRTVIPPNPMTMKPDVYAIALEQRLIQNFCFIANDTRLANMSFDSGFKAKNPFAGLVYVAFKLSTNVYNNEHTESTIINGHKVKVIEF